MDNKEQNEFAKRLKQKYELSVPEDVVASIYASRPNVTPLFARASFRSGGTVRSSERVHARQQRRNFLRNLVGLAAISLPALIWLKAAYFSAPVETPSYVTNTAIQANSVAPPGGRLLVSASSVPTGQSMTFNDPSLGQFDLIHLANGQFAAYSTTCTHAGCPVQFDPSSMDLICPCHGAVYDPSNGAQVLSGPAPFPLQNIPVQYDPSTGNVYLMA